MGRPLLPLALCLLTATAHAQQPTDLQPAEAPLPPIRELILAVDANTRANEALQDDYTYHVHADEEDYDRGGKLKKSTITDSESLTIDGVRVDRAVERDGKPLTPEETAKENERIDKSVAKGKEQRQKKEEHGKDTNQNGDDLLSGARILELGTFSNERRVLVDGRPTIVLDYTGNPDAETHNRFEGVFRALVGTIWIDEADRIGIEAQGHFVRDFKVAGGLLADVHKDFAFDAHFTRVNNEVWIIRSVEAHGSGRLFLFESISGSYQLATSNYRKFHTSSTIIPTGRVIGPDGQPQAPPNSGQEPKPASPQ